MATDLEKLVVSLSADIRSYQNAMQKAVGVTNRQVKQIEDRYKRMNQTLSQSLAAPLAGLGAALSTAEVIKYADAWTQAGNMVRAAGQASGVQTRSLEELRKGADEARVSLEAYSGLYANLIRSASGVAKSEAEIARATELVSKAMKAGGASTQEQQSAIQQLGQALTSGVLQGDEFRSLRENAPVLAAAIAKEFDTTVGGLRKLSEEGKLSADRVFKAILGYAPQIEAQFKATNQTIAEGFTAVGNALTQYVGTMAQSAGITTAVNNIMGALAGNIDTVANAAAAAGIILLSRYVPALTRVVAAQGLMLATNPFLLAAVGAAAASIAIAEFGDEIHPIAGDMANLQDYVGAIWDMISSGASSAATAASDAFLAMINAISDAVSGVQASWADVGAFVKDVINNMIGNMVAMASIVETTLTQIPAAFADSVISRVNAVIAAVERMANAVVSAANSAIGALNSVAGTEIGAFPSVNLGRVTNDYAGAGRAAGEAYTQGVTEALNRDYLGEAFEAVRRQANERAQRRSETGGTTYDAPSNDGYGTAPPAAPSGGGSGGKAKKGKQNEYEKEIEQITRRTAALQAETAAQAGLNPLVDDYGYAVAKAKAMQDLETAAKEAGIKVTAEQRAAMESLAEGYARAVEASNRLTESQDKLRQSAEDFQNLSQNTARSFVQDLIEGKSAADALAEALGRVGDKLLDMAFDNIFDPKTGLFQNLGNSLATWWSGGAASVAPGAGGVVPALYHNGGVVGFGGSSAGRAYSPSLWANAPRYHNGGIAGLKPNEVPAILLRGERVSRVGERASAAGMHITVGVSADNNGNLLPFVESVSQRQVRQSAPKIVNQSVGAVRSANKASKRLMGL